VGACDAELMKGFAIEYIPTARRQWLKHSVKLDSMEEVLKRTDFVFTHNKVINGNHRHDRYHAQRVDYAEY
jgi:hypothetical protein